ncbi:MAG: ComF family protein [Spirochaetales bacterium]|nr:ComF family protein [Spirochaetales bacterium]
MSAINRDADSIRCPVCGKPTISESGLCMRCRATEYGFDSAYPLSRYADDARTLLLAYKSRGRRSLAGFYAKLLADAVRKRYAGRVLVPVPPRPGKIRRKGWDQVERIAGILERRYGVQIARILYRTDGLQQKGLGRDDRAANMRGRIRLQGDGDIPREPVLLDDVLTTGATLSECAAALKAAGAQRVDALAIAAD